MTVEPGEGLASSAGLDAVLLGGVIAQADGSLGGQLPNVALGQSVAAYPIIRDYTAAGADPNLTSQLLTDPVARANHLQTLASFGASDAYAGLVLDYRGVAFELKTNYAEFVTSLAQQLHAQGKKLLVEMPLPVSQPGSALDRDRFVTGSYEWRAIGASADALLIAVAQAPADYGNGAADALLTWATGEVERSRLCLLTSAHSIDGTNGNYNPIAPAAVLTQFGSIATPPSALFSGQPVTLTLSGKAQNLAYDGQAFAARYTYNDGAEHTVWLTSASTLSQRLALASKHGLGGVAVTELTAPGISTDLLSALLQYKTNAAATALAQAQVVWTVHDAAGAVVQATALPVLGYVYVAQAPGDYQFSAELQSGSSANLGSVKVSIADMPTQRLLPSLRRGPSQAQPAAVPARETQALAARTQEAPALATLALPATLAALCRLLSLRQGHLSWAGKCLATLPILAR